MDRTAYTISLQVIHCSTTMGRPSQQWIMCFRFCFNLAGICGAGGGRHGGHGLCWI
ncbi:MAG: hypothetical protein ACLR23_17930 [Clostridia bacterium]